MLLFAAVSTIVFAAPTGINPALGLRLSNPEGVQAGAASVFEGEGKKVVVRRTFLPETEGERAAAINLTQVRGLYAPKKNPYEGEITSLIDCDKGHAPEEFTVNCAGRVTKALAGGVGERDAFGFCGNAKKLGVYFSCYDPASKELLEVRAFEDFGGKPLKWEDRIKTIKGWTAKLFP